MLGLTNLKTKISVTSTTVECPVKFCGQIVARQQRSFRREERFKCPDHKIYISPSTFEYARESENLLWNNEADMALLAAIKTVKRESRLARDNSEDALTWNVFRFLENTNQLAPLLSYVTQTSHSHAELIYWSYSRTGNGAWLELNKARTEFGEHLQRSSEPDLIAMTDTALFFIEAKLTVTNNTLPSQANERKKYLTGGNQWHAQVFASKYENVAIQAKKYELFRFWLLGSWLASAMDKDFYLLNVVPSARESDIEAQFALHIQANHQRQFKRLSWESIYRYIDTEASNSPEKQMFSNYFKNKTTGYNRFGELQKAFVLEEG
jgi:hypothetical protein